MDDDLVLVQVTSPGDHSGDVMGKLNSVKGWLDGFTETDLTRILARIPRSAVPLIEEWVKQELHGLGEFTVLAGREGNA
jgi:hypothetical protein